MNEKNIQYYKRMKFARAIFKYNQNHNFYGCVNFYQKGKNDSVLVEYNIFDNSFLPVSINRRIVVRGLHIHDKYLTPREIENNKCGEACAHFNNGKPIYSRLNTNGTKHGYHTGDLKFNAIFENGVCKELFFDDKISLYPGYKNCILKKSLVFCVDVICLPKVLGCRRPGTLARESAPVCHARRKSASAKLL